MASQAAPHLSRAVTRHELLIDAAVAVAVFAAGLALLASGSDFGDQTADVDGVGVVLTALASLPLAARRRAPLAVFVVTALASSALYAIAAPAGPPVGPTLALYWLAGAGDESPARARLTLGVAGALLAVHVAASGVGAGRFPGVELLFGVLVWGGAWLAGDRARLRRERLAALEERARRAEREAERERRLAAAEERARIARELHDSAGHAINVILVHAGLGRLQAAADETSARAQFEIIEQVARETVGEIDQLVGALREDASAEDRRAVEPPPGLAALPGLVARQRSAGLDVTTSVRGDKRALSPGVDRGAFRILQEALTNAARHGTGGARVEVAFEPEALELAVSNPLRRDGSASTTGGGHGVAGMRERAALLGGTLEAGPRGDAFHVRARLPLAGGGA